MVWTGIRVEKHSSFFFVDSAVQYRDGNLEPIVLPFTAKMGNNFVFMHDNGHLHSAMVVR